MATPATGMPPVAPDVRRQQQGPALSQYAQGAMQHAASQGQTQQATSVDYAKQELGKVAASLMEVMKILSVEKPALMPIATKMAGMGKVLEQQLSQEAQGQGTRVAGSEQPKAQMNSAEGPGSVGM